MLIQEKSFDLQTREKLEQITDRGSASAAEAISWLLDERVRVAGASWGYKNYSDILDEFGGPEAEIVGIYIEARDDLPLHGLLLIPLEEALRLASGLTGQPVELMSGIDELANSALAELINVAGTNFLNIVSEVTGRTLRPSTPAVLIDMLASVMTVIIAKTGCIEGDLFVFAASLERENGSVMQLRIMSAPEHLTDRVLSDVEDAE